MQKIRVPVKLGDKEIIVEVDGDTMADCVRQIAPWQALEGISGGKTGVVFSHRRTRDDNEYFALRCYSENKEFPLGQSQKRKGELFPGRLVKTGGQKKTVKQWEPIQYGIDHGEDDDQREPAAETEKEPEPPGKAEKEPEPPTRKLHSVPNPPAPQQATQASGKQQPKAGEPLPEEKRALAFVAMQLVMVTNRKGNKPDQWEVGNDGPDGRSVTVWLDMQERPQCSCTELISRRKAEPGYRCAHILAVRFYHDQLKQQQAKKAS